MRTHLPAAALVATLAAGPVLLAGGPETLPPAVTAATAGATPPRAHQTPPAEVSDRADPVRRPEEPAASRARDRGRKAHPVRWVPALARYRTTSCFGPRWGAVHDGIDMAAPYGTPVRSVGAGRVTFAGWFSGYGYAVLVLHPDGWATFYAHASRLRTRESARVAAGTVIAEVGSTGWSTGNHLHLGLSREASVPAVAGRFVNPARWLRDRGIGVPACG